MIKDKLTMGFVELRHFKSSFSSFISYIAWNCVSEILKDTNFWLAMFMADTYRVEIYL